MKAIDAIKAFFITVFTILSSILGVLTIPFLLLVVTNVIDYITGLIAAKHRGEKLTSYKGIWGIVKKIMMWLLVAVGSIVDYILLTMGQTLHLNVSVGSAVALIVIFWLMANELISILENIDEVGVPLPPFLMKLVSLIKEKVEDTSKIEAGKTEPHKLE